MRAWIENFTGEYFESPDNVVYSASFAIEVKPRPSKEADDEIKIQQTRSKVLRELALERIEKETNTTT
jgi:hypothetical protein